MSVFANMLISLVAFLIVHSSEIVSATADSDKDRFVSLERESVKNSSNISSACHLTIIRSSLKKIEKLMRDRKTNVIKLNVRIKIINNVINKTRLFGNIQWASEVGRTLYSLMHQSTFLGLSSSQTYTLAAGIRDVNIFVSDENEKCLLSPNASSDHEIFSLLLRQVYPLNDDDTDYQLCRAHFNNNDETNLKYNCCAIVGEEEITICSEYSSTVISFFPGFLTAAVFIFLYLAFPLILDYLSRFQKENEYYKISESPMALSSLLHKAFISGHGPVKPFGRKLLFVVFVLVMGVYVRNIPFESVSAQITWYIFVFSWAFIFMTYDAYEFNCNWRNPRLLTLPTRLPIWLPTFKHPIEIIVLPFNIRFWWRMIDSDEWECFRNNLTLELESTERTRSMEVQQYEDNFHNQLPGTSSESEHTEHTRLLEPAVQQQGVRRQGFVESLRQRLQKSVPVWKYRASIFCLILLYLVVALPVSCVVNLVVLSQAYLWKWYSPATQRQKATFCPKLRFITFHVPTIVVVQYTFMTFFSLTLLFTIGLFLNGETYSHYVVPFSTILFYAWVNWKSSGEAKYLVLNTKIYECCKESRSVQGEGQESNTFVIKLDNYDGEPIIPKKLYDKVREEFLPYDRVLFRYFIGVFSVAIFAYFLFILISLFQTSGVSESVQAIGSITATTLPFIFDLVWRKNSGEQNEANSIALKAKLKRVLVVRSSDENSGKIVVEFIGET